MKTKYIEATLRNAATPAARLAAWQDKPAPRRLVEIRNYLGKQYHAGETLAQARRALIAAQGPELSSPENNEPLLWVSERSPEVLDVFAGRAFLNHCGWYTDDEIQDETFETVAVRLARFPRLLFYGVIDSCNDDIRVHLQDWEEIDFSASGYRSADCPEDAIRETARALVRSNDSTTQREADDAREYYRRDRAEQTIADNRATLAAIRPEIRDLAHELRQPGNRATPDAPLVRAACKNLRALLQDRCDLMAENQTLAASL